MQPDEDVTEDDTYESMTVAELKEELAVRDLHTSGSKVELITRLEEDDAAEEAAETPGDEEGAAASKDLVPTEQESEEPPVYTPVYSPYELPANTAAAQAFMDAHPEAVDTELQLEPERQELATANIQDHVDQMAEMGIEVEDPRLGGTPAVEEDTKDEADTEEVADAV